MSRNNDVFQVLVTSGNAAPLAVGSKVTALAPGQIGVFDYNTNLAIDGTGQNRNFYMAVGVSADGSGNTTDIQKSSGSNIQKRFIQAYAYRPHTPGRPMQVLLSDYTADCETEYGLKLEFRNQEIYRTQGYNQFTKTYSIVTGCCNGCEPTCPSGDANEITRLLAININNDPSGLVTAQAVARQALTAATHGVAADIADGGVVSDADLTAIMAYNATQTDPADYVYTDLLISTVTQAQAGFNGSVNLQYFNSRETVIIPAKIEGFKCNGTLTTVQQAAFEEGSGYDIKQLEYIASGWKQGPYRLSTLNGVADERAFNAVVGTKYDQIALTYDQFSVGGWLEYLNNLASIIAIPAADTVTRNAITVILDRLVAPGGFEALADDAAAAVTNVATLETTTGKNDVTKDGISA